MREPERIDRIASLLKRAWKKTPDQRLGQLLSNITDGEIENALVLWNLEDTEWEGFLQDYVKSKELAGDKNQRQETLF